MITSTRNRVIIYVLAFFVAGIISLAFSFPSEKVTGIIKRQLTVNTGGTLTISEASLAFPASVVISDLRFTSRGDEIFIGVARVDPGFWGLLIGRKSADIDVAGPWGDAKLSVADQGSERELVVREVDADLARLLTGVSLPVDLAGQVTGKLNLRSGPGDGGPVSGEGSLMAADLIVSGALLEMVGAGQVNVERLSLDWTAEENKFTVQEGRFTGDISGDLTGSFVAQPDQPGRSRLALSITITPAPAAAGKLSALYLLAGLKDDGRPVRIGIGGTLARPTVVTR
jgi:type II secretion system protein N